MPRSVSQRQAGDGDDVARVAVEAAHRDVARRRRPQSDTSPEESDVSVPAARVPANKGRTYPAEILTPDEVRALIRAGSAKAPTGIRNRALIVTLYRGGLRLAETLALYPKDVDAGRGTVRVLHGKGDRARTVGLDSASSLLIRRGRPFGSPPDGPPVCPW